MNNILLVKPNENYHCLGTDIRLDSNKVYEARIATNQPEFREKGKIFVEEILLQKGEYEIIEGEFQ